MIRVMKNSYLFFLLRSAPFFPALYFHSQKVKKSITFLPPARQPEGFVHYENGNIVKVLFVGESSFAGVGSDYHKNSFAGYFAATFSRFYKRSVAWEVNARSGFTVKKIREYVLPQISRNDYDLIVLGIGANDTFEMTPPRTFKRNIESLIIDLEEKFPEKPVLFVQFPTVEKFPAFSQLMQKVLGDYKDLLGNILHKKTINTKNFYYPNRKIEVDRWLGHLDEGQTITAFFSDGVHPSELTYQLWAEESVEFLSKNNLYFD